MIRSTSSFGQDVATCPRQPRQASWCGHLAPTAGIASRAAFFSSPATEAHCLLSLLGIHLSHTFRIVAFVGSVWWQAGWINTVSLGCSLFMRSFSSTSLIFVACGSYTNCLALSGRRFSGTAQAQALQICFPGEGCLPKVVGLELVVVGADGL